MKIAVTSSGTTLDDRMDARFGRCPFFLLIDSDSLTFQAIPNPNMALSGGAGPQSVRLLADHGVSVVLTGNCGPNAFQAFDAAGIQLVTGVSGRIRDAVDRFTSGRLTQSSGPSVQGHFGTGMGGGRGQCGGFQRGGR